MTQSHRAKGATRRRPVPRRGDLTPIRTLRPNALAIFATLCAAAGVLANCSPVTFEIPAQPVPPANYGQIVAMALKPYPDFVGYANFEISAPRWVHTETGWNWLSCLRFQDHGRRRIYSFFINNGVVVDARYDTITDRCGAQQYQPFDRISGMIGAPMEQAPQPGYVGLPTLQPQQPIY